MDGAFIATIISSSVVVGGAIGGGFWKLGRAIGRLEGKIEGVDKSMQNHDNQIKGCSDRIDRLDKRINGFLNNLVKPGG